MGVLGMYFSVRILVLNVFLVSLLLQGGCRKDITRPPIWTLLIAQSSPNNIGVVTSDFGGGGRYNVVEPRGGFALPGLAPIHSDAIARFQAGRVYIVNRLNRDSIQVLNPEFANLTEREFSVGQGTNPHDIAILSSEKAYISRYNSRSILIVNPQAGIPIGEIDLSRYSENISGGGIPDGLPEMSWMVQFQGRVFVTIQRLDRNHPQGFLPPSGESYLLELDPIRDTVIASYRFQSTNPFSKPQVREIFGEPYLIIATSGRMGFISELDGGVEAFRLASNQFRPGYLLDEKVAGGDILSVQVRNDSEGYASILDRSFNKRIVQFRPDTGSITQVLLEIPHSQATNFSGMVLTQDDLLIVGVSDFRSPGILVFDTHGALRRLTPIPIPLELTPTDILELK